MKEWHFTIPAVIDRGIYKAGLTYAKGDGCTFGGGFWIAQVEITAKPAEGPDWRLAVRRGRDGKDGAAGPKGDMGPAGKDGKDLTKW